MENALRTAFVSDHGRHRRRCRPRCSQLTSVFCSTRQKGVFHSCCWPFHRMSVQMALNCIGLMLRQGRHPVLPRHRYQPRLLRRVQVILGCRGAAVYSRAAKDDKSASSTPPNDTQEGNTCQGDGSTTTGIRLAWTYLVRSKRAPNDPQERNTSREAKAPRLTFG